ncbi:MAG: PD-(D/E)XK nuclease family protein, partial [Patescibacteria group bacterium]
LRFPQAKTSSAAFGSAMHKALELLYRSLRRKNRLPTFKDVSLFFTEALRDERLSAHDFDLQKERGIKSLKAFYATKKKTFCADDLVEVNFKNQGVVILGVPLSGKIDKMVKEKGGEISVYDWKTGEAHISWNSSGLYDKIQLHQYARQLMFYKLLVEHSRDFRKYNVSKGVLEFLEPRKGKIIDLPLTLTEDGVSRTQALISVVYRKILNLDFPSIEKYEKNLSGIIAFEDDLLSGKV